MSRAWGLVRALGLGLLATGCLAPPPPILVETPYGHVRADTREKATEVAELLREYAPQVRSLLPGSQARAVDVWVQDELRVYRHTARPESVRGFTLLADEFEAKRIHLQSSGQSAWYLSHELVHALVDTSWKPLPGILEEGLADVVAEILNPDQANHIRAHRLLNCGAFTGGIELRLAYSVPEKGRRSREWAREEVPFQVSTSGTQPAAQLPLLFAADRSRLHEDWPELPEPFYGIAWLVTSRIVERRGLDGLHELCQRARAEGLDLIPLEWIEAAAEIDLARLDAAFLYGCFGFGEMRSAALLQNETFARAAIDVLKPHRPFFRTRRALIYYVDPTLRLQDGSEVRMRQLGSVVGGIYRHWGR